MSLKHITANGLRLAYRIDGPADGAPVLLLNSLGTTYRLWDKQIDRLVQRFRVVRCDLRGHGASDVPDGESSIVDLARDADALLAQLGIAQAYVVGLSLGGMAAQALALQTPERVRALVLCATACQMGTPDGWNERIATVQSQGTAALADGILERWFTPAFRQAHPDDVGAIREQIVATPTAGYASCCAAVRDMALCERLGAVQVPALCVAGDDDPGTTPAVLRDLAARLPYGRFAEVGPARHLMNVEQPGRFNEVLMSFLDEELASARSH